MIDLKLYRINKLIKFLMKIYFSVSEFSVVPDDGTRWISNFRGEFTIPLSMVQEQNHSQARRNEINIGGLRVKWGFGDLAARKLLETTPFVSLKTPLL